MEFPQIALLVSGDSSLVNAAKAELDRKFYGFIPFVIANLDCLAYQHAKELGIDAFLVGEQEGADRSAEPEIERHLDDRNPVLIIAAGYHRIFSPRFCEKYKGKLVNFHPSLLPAFAGLFDMAVHQAVLGRGCRISGATVHFIDADVDTGKIIFQLPVAVDGFDTPETLKKRVQHVETELFPKLLGLALDGKLQRLC